MKKRKVVENNISDDVFEDFPNHNRFDFPKYLKRVTSGSGGESILIFGSEKTAIYDTGMAYCHDRLIENISQALESDHRDSLDFVFLSHTHYDHIGALPYIIEKWPNVNVVASQKAKEVFKSTGALKLIKHLGTSARDLYTDSKEAISTSGLRVDTVVREGDSISLGIETIDVIEAKGHTDCSLAYMLNPYSIMFASESTGLLRSPTCMNTAFLKSYEDTLESARRCKACNPRSIIAPHFGMIPSYFTDDFFDLYIKSAEEEKAFIEKCYNRKMTFDEVYKEFENKYWSEERAKAQPKAAFKENALISIRLILNSML